MTSRQFRTRLAVDIGGTFVDAIELDRDGNTVKLAKALSTPREPWIGVLNSVRELGVDLAEVDRFIHGTTMGLNSLLERRGAVTGIITNSGFRDIFLIGRGNVPDEAMFDFRWQKPTALVRRRHTAGVPGRVDAQGEVIENLDDQAVLSAATALIAQGVEAIAICFLHSYRNPEHEQRSASLIAEAFPAIPIAISSDICGEYREYERTSTTVIDAYVRPVFGDYVARLEESLQTSGFSGRFLIMRSGGGAASSMEAKRSPTQTLLSGPAGGIVGAAQVAHQQSRPELLTIDVGGTSLDACVIENGKPVTLFETAIEQHPILIPMYDIRAIGTGGGSIARIDHGLLKVGPRSAGAEPGPACYGRGGTEPTVTDAALCLGYIDPDRFLGGSMPLHATDARAALKAQVGDPMGVDVTTAAALVFDVLVAQTVTALRQITVERGRDPQTFAMLAFGGAGPLIAPLLARSLGIAEVIIPNKPSGFSAWGMLGAELISDYARSSLHELDELTDGHLEHMFSELETSAADSITLQAGPDSQPLLERYIDLRYVGQEHSLTIPVQGSIDRQQLRNTFEVQHRARYGHAMTNPLQVVTVRARAIDATASAVVLPRIAPRNSGDVREARLGARAAWCVASSRMREFNVYVRAALRGGDRIKGPAIVEDGTSSAVFFADQELYVDEYGYLSIKRSEPEL